MNYQILEHTGDLKIKVWGRDLPELFKNAAAAMFSAVAGRTTTRTTTNEQRATKTRPDLKSPTLRREKPKKIEIKGADYESLLVNFLNELLYLSDVQNKGFLAQNIEIKENGSKKLTAQLLSLPLPPLEVEIKSATYHDLKITKTAAGYETTVVFDI